MKKRAVWNNKTLAESDATIEVEGNTYFPPDALDSDVLRDSDTHTECPWKGTASYYHVVVDGERNEDAAWYYPNVKKAAEQIKGYVAFWGGVEVLDVPD